MPFIEWDESFVTGVHEFDVDHQHIVGLLNKTYDDFICGAPDDSIGTILNELVEYAGHHFLAEEVWMREHGYPGLSEHKLEHDSFTRTVSGFQADFSAGKAHLSLEVLTFLKKWVRTHLLETDADYGRHRAKENK